MNSRRQSRETVFALLFELSFKENGSMDEIVENATDVRDISFDKFTRNLLDKVVGNLEAIDNVIEKYSESWKINRISKVSLAILRMALGEIMFFDDIPEGATINEAVELAKEYGSEDDSAYLNGILGNFVRTELPQKGV